MDNKQLNPIIDKILENYFNSKTRLSYNRKVQADMVAQNRGLLNACEAVISFADDQFKLAAYTRNKIEEINNGEAQEISFRGGEK